MYIEGGGIKLRLLPNMRIVIELEGGGVKPGETGAMPTEACTQIAQAAVAAARAAEAAVAC